MGTIHITAYPIHMSFDDKEWEQVRFRARAARRVECNFKASNAALPTGIPDVLPRPTNR